MKQEEFTYHHFEQLPLKATLYRSKQPSIKQTVLYFHGGGLVYGSRSDIPQEYINQFLNAGYHFIAFDYPLAPESNLDEIYSAVKEAVTWFLNEARASLNLESSDYISFGRSAGAFLCLLLARDKSLPSPKKIINFYGYDSLEYKEFQEASAFYSQYSKIPEQMVDKIVQPKPVSTGPLQTRYVLYLYARQTGKWTHLLQNFKASANLSKLTKSEGKLFPPTFIAHSTDDKDVPYRIAEHLNKTIARSYLHTVHNMEHDFDRQVDSPEAQNAYAELLDWLKNT